MKLTYMDNAATTYPKPESVYLAMDHFNRHMGGNPGRGTNQPTLKAGSILLEARETLAKLFNIDDSLQIAFTSNITDSLNIGLKGILQAGDHIITTSMEHNSVARPIFVLEKSGVQWTKVPTAPDGTLNPDDVKKAILPNTRMICILHASNVTGTIMPILEIGEIARDNNVLFMVDTAQSAGVLSVDVVKQNIDILTFTGHKGLLGPQGTGGIYIKPGINLKPSRQGGTGSLSEHLEHPEVMPDLLESGTLNTPGIAGLLAGVKFIHQIGLNVISEQERKLTDLLLNGLKEIKGVKIYGPQDSKKKTAVIAFNIGDMDCGEVSLLLDHEYSIVTRSGIHCSPLAHQTLGTLEQGLVRLSPGYFTNVEDIEYTIKAIHRIAKA
ncbi:MAG TPA: aminotransferase class V-fold PLP-dependent enzyme [Syntrophomonadaceae bacterium]|nr:aminotransferase class V-fold PLP-dependent enzyme [Syntrophomonadaceae bacterium]